VIFPFRTANENHSDPLLGFFIEDKLYRKDYAAINV